MPYEYGSREFMEGLPSFTLTDVEKRANVDLMEKTTNIKPGDTVKVLDKSFNPDFIWTVVEFLGDKVGIKKPNSTKLEYVRLCDVSKFEDTTDSKTDVGRPVRITAPSPIGLLGKTGEVRFDKNDHGSYGIYFSHITTGPNTLYFKGDEFEFIDEPDNQRRYKITELSTGKFKWRVEQTHPKKFIGDYWDFETVEAAREWCGKDGIIEKIDTNCTYRVLEEMQRKLDKARENRSKDYQAGFKDGLKKATKTTTDKDDKTLDVYLVCCYDVDGSLVVVEGGSDLDVLKYNYVDPDGDEWIVKVPLPYKKMVESQPDPLPVVELDVS